MDTQAAFSVLTRPMPTKPFALASLLRPSMLSAARFTLAGVALCCLAACPDVETQRKTAPAGGIGVPLDPNSPWPKFRRNPQQTGLSELSPKAGGLFWSVQTAKGIFSSPVVDGDGNIYVGSADRVFYALARDGSVKWTYQTGEIIDSSALLDDQGKVYFGSGDGHLYALNRADGTLVWKFAADPPSVNEAFINWFEGNVAMTPDGDLLAPNDNFFVYRVDRNTGALKWTYAMKDQTWSLPAVDPSTGDLFMGNNNLLELLGSNIFAYDSGNALRWDAFVPGTVAASFMLHPQGLAVVGGFDGYLHAWDRASGMQAWSVPTRDHIYASPSTLPDGTIIQASADGTVYALRPLDGSLVWSFDTREPLRSSPAVGADGRIYLGSGEGRLFVLNPDGTLRWAVRLVDDVRNDLNASPALGVDAVYVAAESGQIFSVPYDFCERTDAEATARCLLGPQEDVPGEGASLQFTTELGALVDPPTEVDARQVLVLSLTVRQDGDSRLATLDANAVTVTTTPVTPVETTVSGDGRYLSVVPQTRWNAGADGRFTLSVQAPYLTNHTRAGLKLSGGTVAGNVSTSVTLAVRPSAQANLPLPVPTSPGAPAGLWEMSRLAVPVPTLMPSYNQIGFDSLHWLIGLVGADAAGNPLAFVTGALLDANGAVVLDPASKALFPLTLGRDGDSVAFLNQGGFSLEALNATIQFQSFRMDGRLDAQGAVVGDLRMLVSTVCSEIPFYGAFLQGLGLCNPQTDLLLAYGASQFRPHLTGTHVAPAGVGAVTFQRDSRGVHATVAGSTLVAADHAVALLLLDGVTRAPVNVAYGLNTTKDANGGGQLTAVHLTPGTATLPASLQAVLLVDLYPVASQSLP